MKLEESFRALNKLVGDGKVRHLGVSNFGLSLLERSRELSETPILTNQVPLSMLDRKYVRNGMLAYCQANAIVLTAYSPFEAGKFRASRVLADVAKRYSATPHQIALAWLCNQPRVITIPMSFDAAHQSENIDAADISLSPQDLAQLGQTPASGTRQ
jgi:diketogulonate reductase-like aldo/keto reductase